MMNLQQSVNDDIRCEISNHFLDKIQYVCVFDKCAAEQRLCCSYCKFRFHNQHIQHLVKFNDFTNKVQKDGEMLKLKLQDQGEKGQLNYLYEEKIDKKIVDEIQYANMKMQCVFSAIHSQVTANIISIHNNIDQRALGQSVLDLQAQLQRILNRPWSHQSNEAIQLMTKIYRGDKYGELLEDQYFMSHKNIQSLNNYFTTVHAKLEAFFKNIQEQVPLIFLESFSNNSEKQQGEFPLSIRRKEQDQSFPSIRTSSMLREKSNNGGSNIQNNSIYQLPQNTKPLISTQKSRSKKDLDNLNNTLDDERNGIKYEQQPNNQSNTQYGKRNNSSLGNLYNTERQQSTLFKQYDNNKQQPNRFNSRANVDSLDQFTQQHAIQGRNSNQGYYPFNQDDTFSKSEDPYINYQSQRQQIRGQPDQSNSIDSNYHQHQQQQQNSGYGSQQNYQGNNQFAQGNREQVILQEDQQNGCLSENDILNSNLSQYKLKQQQVSSIKAINQFKLKKTNKFIKSHLSRMNFARFILESNPFQDCVQISKEEGIQKQQQQQTKELDKAQSNSLENIKEIEEPTEPSQGKKRFNSLVSNHLHEQCQSQLYQPILINQKHKKTHTKQTFSCGKLRNALNNSPYKQQNYNKLQQNNSSPKNVGSLPNKTKQKNMINYNLNNIIFNQINQGQYLKNNQNGSFDYASPVRQSSPLQRYDQANNQNPSSLSYIPQNEFENNLSPSKTYSESPQRSRQMMSIIIPSEFNKGSIPQGSRVQIPNDSENKPSSHIRLPPQPNNYEDYKLKVQQVPLEFIRKNLETDSKKIKQNKPQKNWKPQKSLPKDLPHLKILNETQQKWGFVDIADTNNGQSRLEVHKSEQGNIYYDGEWFQGKRHGKGTLYMEDGSIYQGEWNNDEMIGKGRIIKKEGDIYEGDFVKEQFDGKGYLRYANGTEYIGNWKNNLFQGEGRKQWQNGAYYDGSFNGNQREGEGVFMWKNGSFYQGQFSNNQFNGKGIYQWQSGRLYEGEWKDGKMQGHGRDILEQGYVYEGQYDNDKKHGYGVFKFNENKLYKGNWDNDHPHGEGLMIENGVEMKGIWEQGQLIQKL